MITFGGLIKLYTRKAAMASAARVVAEMRARGIPHSKQTHSMLISGHAAAGDVEAAYAAFQDMARSKYGPFVLLENSSYRFAKLRATTEFVGCSRIPP